MVARGQFRHHPPVIEVQFGLGKQPMRQEALAGIVEGYAGVIA